MLVQRRRRWPNITSTLGDDYTMRYDKEDILFDMLVRLLGHAVLH